MKVYQAEINDGALFALILIEPNEIQTDDDGSVKDSQLEEAIFNAIISLANIKELNLLYTTVLDVDEQEDGSVMFSLEAVIAPKVLLGPYKELYVTPKPEELFEDAALKLAAQFVEADIPGLLVQKELEGMIASTKAKIFREPYLNVLSDVHTILLDIYIKEDDAPDKDILWQRAIETMGEEAGFSPEDLTSEDIHISIVEALKDYGLQKEGLSESVGRAAEKRAYERENMSPDDMAAQIFDTYLHTLRKTEDQWRNEMLQEALFQAKLHLMLDAIAEKEYLTVTEDELSKNLLSISGQFGLSVEDISREIDVEAVRYHLTREKAIKLVVESSKRVSGWD